MTFILRRLPAILAACLFTGALYGAVIPVPAGANLQTALNTANPGDTIVLTAGATYTGNFVLPAKSGSGYITITTSQPSLLPSSGKRVTPAHRSAMPKLVSPKGGSIFTVAANAKHYKLHGLEITVAANVYGYDLISLTSPTPASLSSYPDDIVIDQCYVHGDPSAGSKRGVAANGTNITVQNSYFQDFKSKVQDSQAIAGWSGPGPFKILNNYLEGAGQSVLFGGAAPSVANVIPSDIQVMYNHMNKPLSWRGVWYVKNLFELKNARRVTIQNNVFENNWVSAQSGFGILFTVRTCESGNYPWAVVQNVNFSYNILRNSDHGVNILGTDTVRSNCGGGTAGLTSDISIQNNLFDNIGAPSSGIFLQVLSNVQRLTVDHNTVLAGRSIIVAEGITNPQFIFQNNITVTTKMGVIGTGTGEGIPTLNTYFPGWVFRRNGIAGLLTAAKTHPTNNLYLPTLDAVGFVNAVGRDYHLSAVSTFKNAGTDGKDLGADIDGVLQKTAAAVSGSSSASTSSAPVLSAPSSDTYTLKAGTDSSGKLTISWSIPAATASTASIGLYEPDQARSYWSVPLNGAATGVQTVTAPLTAGLYEFRCLLLDGSTKAESNTVTYAPPASPEPVSSTPQTTYTVGLSVDSWGQAIIQWKAPEGRPANDWIALYAAGAANHMWYFRTNGAPTGTMAIPMNLPAGQYSVRYYLQGLFTLGDESNTITYAPSKPPYSVTAQNASGIVTIKWTAPPGRPANDWVAIRPVGGQVLWWTATNGAVSGVFTTPRAAAPGTYEVLYNVAGTYTLATKTLLTIP